MAVTSDTPVPTTEGWVRAHALTTKHVVFDVEGNPQPVKGVQLYIPAECYEASFHDGVAVRGDRHMSFELQDKTWRDRRGSWAKNRGKKGARKSMKRPLKKKSVHELSRESLARRMADVSTHYQQRCRSSTRGLTFPSRPTLWVCSWLRSARPSVTGYVRSTTSSG